MKQWHRDEHDELVRHIQSLARRIDKLEQAHWKPSHEATLLADCITRGSELIAHNLGLPLDSQNLAYVRQCIIEDKDR